jgi:hypothetical protein
VRTYKHLVHETLTVRLANGAGKVVDTLTATPTHPFFVPGRGAIPLGQLGIGTQIMTRAGPPLVIASLVKHEYPQGIAVYNFEVQGDHTYFVGNANGGTWVHNDCGIDLDAASQAGNVADKNLFTRAGRALQKHTSPGRTFGYSTPLDKTAKGYNEAGQQVLDDILTDPNGVATGRVHQIYGPVHEIMTPRGGVRFGAGNYHFYGFLDP